MDLERLTATDIARGYTVTTGAQGESCQCVVCGARFAAGEVYPVEGHWYQPQAAAQRHVQTAHARRLEELLASDSKYISLTDNQRALLTLFSQGLSDADVAARLGVTASTVRHQRFVLREKAKAAKLYAALWQLVQEARESLSVDDGAAGELLPVHAGATMVDERYEMTQGEYEKILATVFETQQPLRLRVFSAKEKKKIAILHRIAQEFEPGRQYTEKDVRAVLAPIFDDYVTLRRYLIAYGYLDRTRDGTAYWRT